MGGSVLRSERLRVALGVGVLVGLALLAPPNGTRLPEELAGPVVTARALAPGDLAAQRARVRRRARRPALLLVELASDRLRYEYAAVELNEAMEGRAGAGAVDDECVVRRLESLEASAAKMRLWSSGYAWLRRLRRANEADHATYRDALRAVLDEAADTPSSSIRVPSASGLGDLLEEWRALEAEEAAAVLESVDIHPDVPPQLRLKALRSLRESVGHQLRLDVSEFLGVRMDTLPTGPLALSGAWNPPREPETEPASGEVDEFAAALLRQWKRDRSD